MIASIVACGDSAEGWFKVPVDFSVGVNDCVKFGHEVDNLVVVNSPSKFNPCQKNGYVNRFKTITESKPKLFLCHNSNWKPYFPNAEMIAMRSFIGLYKKGKIYHTKTSPFVAITLAVNMGVTELILWGIDMLNHHKFSEGKRDFHTERDYYRLLFEQLDRYGIKVWIGNENTVLKEYLPVYKSISSNSEVMAK